jgi:hypothetical protein
MAGGNPKVHPYVYCSEQFTVRTFIQAGYTTGVISLTDTCGHSHHLLSTPGRGAVGVYNLLKRHDVLLKMLHLGLPSGLHPSGFPNNISHLSPARYMPLDLIILTFSEEYKLWS